MVLDAEVMRIFLCGESGAERVARALEEPCWMTTISVAVLASRTSDLNLRDLIEDFGRLNIGVADVNTQLMSDAVKRLDAGIDPEIAFAIALAQHIELDVLLANRPANSSVLTVGRSLKVVFAH
jgi:PIN domain nuclease of toxin-antitoxin system